MKMIYDIISYHYFNDMHSAVGPIGQKALNKVVFYTDATLTLPDATRRYQTLPVATRRYQMLTDVIRLSNPTVFRTNLGNSES
jgi:hypothetical protein